MYQWVLPLAAAVYIQCRLLCNLFDGMVAVEGGKSTASGEMYNDIPDRIADPLILVAVGYATDVTACSVELGWCAGLLAVVTAYIRNLAVGMGVPPDFRGPMAKQHRMALVTVACVASAAEPLLGNQGWVFFVTLCLIIVGCVITAWRRILGAYNYLEKK
ncbi:MAG: CDP-alcohol phosphatidyltransferase family protein [Rubritalea sp.]|uniref:CDP-alcohol phosphatidyltransferase family protein n=1 Tax=Rubritalea sp. TaxID=2109375 RepID=UPI00324239F8